MSYAQYRFFVPGKERDYNGESGFLFLESVSCRVGQPGCPERKTSRAEATSAPGQGVGAIGRSDKVSWYHGIIPPEGM